MSIQSRDRLTFEDLYFTREFYRRFLSSLSDPIREIVICSPYFGQLPAPFMDVRQFCAQQQRRGVASIRIITRPPGKESTSLPISVAKDLVTSGVEVFVYTSPYLHAKLYHFEYRKGYFRSFVGSSNFSIGGFRNNHELVAEMEGVGRNSPSHREIERMLNSNGTVKYEAWVANSMPSGKEQEL